jgi:hypothetical protein
MLNDSASEYRVVILAKIAGLLSSLGRWMNPDLPS